MSLKSSLKGAEVLKDTLKDVAKNIKYNEIIVKYYYRFSNESSIVFSKNLLEKKGDSIDYCNKFWLVDRYDKHKIKDFQKTNLCHDKFCANCKKVKQASRMAKYIPHIELYKDSLYHLVLTLPNCSGQDLRLTNKHMAKCFKSLINYLSGHNKIKGVNFGDSYLGAIRSLEVTYNKYSYHPHYHVGLVLKDFKMGEKGHINKYSYDNRTGIKELKRLFSKEELLIQKIWYLLINRVTVNRKNIDNLEDGYSCYMGKFAEGDYAELFKYMTKVTDENGSTLSYENFVNLYYGLHSIKQIQGYGVFYNITDDGDLEKLEEKYEKYINQLKEKESPVSSYEKPQDLVKDTEYMLISRKSFFKYLNEL